MSPNHESAEMRLIEKSWLALGTVVRIQVVTAGTAESAEAAFAQAMSMMRAVEEACSRFDTASELVRLMGAPTGQPIPVSPILYQCLNFALEIAQWTDGRFDPTVGARMEDLGFKRHYLTGELVETGTKAAPEASFRDIVLNEAEQTVCLHRPLKLDLGAVAKGLAVDLAAKELAAFGFQGFVVDAGGDIYVAGLNEHGELWAVGIRHPLKHEETLLTVRLSDSAICTSGTYERPSPVEPGSHHILNAKSKSSARGILSGTAIGPFTMMADALSTAAFLYPPTEALSILMEAGLDGIMVTDDLECHMTPGMERFLDE